MNPQTLVADLLRKSDTTLQSARRTSAPDDPGLLLLEQLKKEIARPQAAAPDPGGSKQILEALFGVVGLLALLELALLTLAVAFLAVLAGMAQNASRERSTDDEYAEQITYAVRQADVVLPQLRARLDDATVRQRTGNCGSNLQAVIVTIELLMSSIRNTSMIVPGRGSRPAAHHQRQLLNNLMQQLNDLVQCAERETDFARELREIILNRESALRFIVRLLGDVTIFR